MDIDQYLSAQSELAYEAFNDELTTDENKDYRRGFRAGVLFAFLDIKSHIGRIDDATTEQPTD